MAEHDPRHSARHGSPHAPARRAAPRRPDLAHGWHWRSAFSPSSSSRAGRSRLLGRRPAPVNQAAAPNPDRLRDYQDRLRVLDERSRQQAPGRRRPTRGARAL